MSDYHDNEEGEQILADEMAEEILADEMAEEILADEMADEIDAGDRDKDGNFIPYPRYP